MRGRYLYAFWHENMLLLAYLYARADVCVLISQHADGELIADVCRHLGLRTVRGSTTRGSVEALRRMLRLARKGHLAITPDGPRGPRRRVQPGVVYLAARTGLPIVPVGVGYRRAWRTRSWDRLALPCPFSLGICVTEEPITVPPGADRQALAEYVRRLEEALHRATEIAEHAAGDRPSRPSRHLKGPHRVEIRRTDGIASVNGCG
jgi:lysophospholipid acyltransferase (LPLAT)-like uncharacterized protein